MKTVKYYDEDTNEWFDTDWSALVSGTMIKIYDGDTAVLDGTRVAEFITATDAFLTTVVSGEEDRWAVECYDPHPFTTLRHE